MQQRGVVWLGTLLSAAMCYGQASTPAAQHPATHGSFPVIISKTLDSSKLKIGDPFDVETAGTFKLADGTLVPKGSKLVGHVTASKARSKGDPDSQLTLAFEELSISGGKQLVMKGTVQAVYPPAEEPMAPSMATAGTSQGGSGAGASPANVGLTNSNSGSNLESSNSQSVTNMSATGVQGVRDLTLDDGVLTSKGKNVKLGSGVRLVVRADIQQ
jgi:hypothetical protein